MTLLCLFIGHNFNLSQDITNNKIVEKYLICRS